MIAAQRTVLHTSPMAEALPLHYFAGRLVEWAWQPVRGLHQVSMRLVDADGATVVVYECFGRGPAAEAAGQALVDALETGRRYFGSSALRQVGTAATYYCGGITLALDARCVHPRYLGLMAGADAPSTRTAGGVPA